MAEMPFQQTHFVNVGDVIKIGGVWGRISEVNTLPNTPSFREIEWRDRVETIVSQVEMGDIIITLKRIPE